MAKVKNTMQLINTTRGKIPAAYDLRSYNAKEICDASSNMYDLISNAFRFWYIQGVKATKAKQKKTIV